jgi:hypothetical protein
VFVDNKGNPMLTAQAPSENPGESGWSELSGNDLE